MAPSQKLYETHRFLLFHPCRPWLACGGLRAGAGDAEALEVSFGMDGTDRISRITDDTKESGPYKFIRFEAGL